MFCVCIFMRCSFLGDRCVSDSMGFAMTDATDTFTIDEREDSFARSFMRVVRQVIRVWCILSLVTGIFATVAASVYRQYIGPRNPSAAASVEFPLSEVADVVADQNGKIIVVLSVYGRLQVYDVSGRFLYGRYVPVGGAFRLFFDQQGRLNVVSARSNKILTYDAQGRIVKREKDLKGKIFQKQTERTLTFTDSKGNHYSVRHPHWNPEIIRKDKTGRQTLSISTPWYLKPLIGNFYSWMMVMASLFMIWLLHERKEKREKGD